MMGTPEDVAAEIYFTPPEEDGDVCKCGHNIHEHEAVHDCKCYVYGCDCDGFEAY